MSIPIKYNVRYLVNRWTGTAATAITFALVVGVFVIILAMVQGIRKALTTAGDPHNVIVMRKGVMAEGLSVITQDQYHAIYDLPGIAKDSKGEPMAGPEFITLVNHPKVGSGEPSNLQLRGVSQEAFELRPEVKIVEGRKFTPGLREAIVGKAASQRFVGLGLGQTVKLGPAQWKIVGLFEAGDSAFNSEVWADVRELMQEFDREQYSTAVLRALDPAAVESIKKLVDEDRKIQLLGQTEEEYYQEQTQSAAPLMAFGGFLSVMMAIGACFAGMNTMYASVAGRVREIGTMRILGFTPFSILLCFLIESVLLAALAGLLGCGVAAGILKLLSYSPVGTTNFFSFSEVIFYFKVTPALMAAGMSFSLAMGFLGGLLPAWGASRMPILSALRQL